MNNLISKYGFTFSLLVLICSFTYANDGTYLTKGGVIYPMKESKISMEKEHLSFKVVDQICSVNIAFEFNNPEKVERKLLIGFQAPTAVGDVPEEQLSENRIADFRVMQNDKILPYTLKIASCEDCELVNIGEWKPANQADEGVFVYLFEVTFQPGTNKISHSYTFPASSNVMADQIYNYILTTGSKWAGGKINDLTVDFDLGENSYFYITDIFGEHADWKIIGTGKVTSNYYDTYDNNQNRMVRILSGILQIQVTDLIPSKNIEFGIIDEISFITRPIDEKGLNENTIQQLSKYSIEDATTKEELRILRNTLYAQNGLSFKSTDLQNYFSQFDWYIADPNLNQDTISLTDQEKELLEFIRKKENQF